MADVLVVGGGSAGCVLAARLSEDPGCEVTLLEAGPDLADAADLPADVVDASGPTLAHDWGYVAEPDRLGRCIALPRAKLIGGCSATNACFALRGAPADYDGWAEMGNPGWSFGDVLPFFRPLEADADFGDQWHDTRGPVPIGRPRLAELNPVQAAFIEAACGYGLAYVADHNRPGAVGVGPVPRNARAGVRMSTALTYLAAARGRPNLTVRGGAMADRIEVRGGTATGVRLAGGEVVTAGRVVLAAGAYASPAILQRSGIGPAAQLRPLGIAVVADLPGVGNNLADHPLVAVDLPARPGTTGPRFQTMATMRSQLAPADGPPDLHLFAAGPFDVGQDASPAGAVFGLVTGLVVPYSRGWVRIRSADPADPPRIDVAHLRHRDDMSRMIEAALTARAISRTAPLNGLIEGPELAPGPAIADGDTSAIAARIASRVDTYHHPAGTCRMGPDPDGNAVVDARAGARHRAPACRRRIHHAGPPLRQHQPAHHHDRRTSCLVDHRRKAPALTDIAELHAQALEATGRIVDGVAADRWHAATPCRGWDARGLVNHLVAGNLWAAELAAGGTIDGAGSRLDGDLLGDDPAAAYAASASAAAAVFRRPGALDAPCAVSYGPVPGSVYAGHRFLDVLVHGWDLAVATGQDYALDPELMQACQQIIEPQLDAFRSAGALAPPVAVPADTNAQTRFLAMLGRTG